jgi:4-amino-4-deoxy-L-arabinose transferase-like glycosyltransferase
MKKRWLIAIIVAYIVVRIYIATLSSYGFYHGWNEGYYSLIAKNYFSGSLWEQIAYTGGGPFSSAPPFFSYAVFAFFKVFGIADISARLVSILSEIIAVFGVYILAKELYNERTADLAAIIFIFIPWNILWFGRAQTDPLMTALMTLAVALYVRAYKSGKSMLPFGMTLGLAVFTKQPALAVLPIVLLWSYFQGVKREQIFNAIACFFAGMIPLFIWLSHSAISGNYELVNSIIFGELAHRSEPLSDLGRVVLFTAAGISPLIIASAAYQILKERNVKNILAIWLLIYGTFVLVRTPPSHEYYSLPLMAPVAIMTSSGIISFSEQYLKCRNKVSILVILIVLAALPISFVLLSFSGDIGYVDTLKAGEFLGEYFTSHADERFLVITQVKYYPQMTWYSNLTMNNRSNRELKLISDVFSMEDIAKAIANYNIQNVFIVTDTINFEMERSYKVVYKYEYRTELPDLVNALVHQKDSIDSKFGQDLSIYMVSGI